MFFFSGTPRHLFHGHGAFRREDRSRAEAQPHQPIIPTHTAIVHIIKIPAGNYLKKKLSEANIFSQRAKMPEAGFLNIAELEINSRITRDSRAQD